MSESNPRKRLLTQQEIKLAQNTIGNAIDWSKVQIANGKWWLIHPHAAMTCGNTIIFPKNYYQSDFSHSSKYNQAWLVHELIHVWQYQHGFPILFAGIILAAKGGYYKRRAYRYGELRKIKAFGQLNMEQQARLIEHYFLAKHGDKRYAPLLPQYRRLLIPFFRQPHNRQLLPIYS